MVRFFSLPALAAFVYAAATASAQQLSTDGQFTIASPKAGGIFVAGALLPCVWHLDDTTPAGFALNVYLESSTVANFNTIAIAAPANVEKTAQWLLPGNESIYEHIVNYALPRTLTAGSYAVCIQKLMVKEMVF
ncbi:hypothetical protein BJV82DRAFT_601575 [Fennellomyces sp. T-0311]|nr:hypothetical protein BJV82DRAFT_601575 [Fennellomyces sp. T-0311]